MTKAALALSALLFSAPATSGRWNGRGLTSTSDYLRKPYSREELLRTINHALEQKHLENENRRISWRLECSENSTRYLVDSSPDIIYTLDQEGRFT